MKRRPDLYVADTVLTTPGHCNLPFGQTNSIHKEKWRLTDGVRHPVKIIQEGKK